MMGRTDYGHDHDADAIRHILARAESDYEKAKAASEAAAATTRHARDYVESLRRRLLHVEHRTV